MKAKNIALILLGMLFGCALMVSVMGNQLEQSYLEQKKLNNTNIELQQEVKSLKERVNKPNQEPLVERVSVDVLNTDKVTEIQTSDYVKQQLAWLINQPVSKLLSSPDIPVKMIDGRTFYIDKKQMVVHVQTVAIGETLYLRVTSTEVSSTSTS